jgi:hypothetical protein
MTAKTGYKTRLCAEFLSSKSCDSGNDCKFAHGKRELRTFENPLYKSQMCTAFLQNGFCQLMGDCLFAHSSDEVRADEEEGSTGFTNLPLNESRSVYGSSTTLSGAGHKSRSDGTTAPACHAFQKNGFCTRGVACPYSHIAKSELNTTSGDAESKFKTALCHAYQKNARCSNGDNCRYAHGVDELQPLPNKEPPPSLDPSDPKYKTKLCIKFEKEKRCVNGDNCNFAHGIEEMRSRGEQEEQKLSDRYKTSVCQVFVDKFLCPRGPNCTYAHGRYELRPVGFKGDFDAKILENPRWKCNLCKVFSETQRCKNGDDCGYAHGEKELRSEKPGPPDIRRFKTELCKKLFTTGFCPQGSLCTFAHSNEDLQAQRSAAGVTGNGGGDLMGAGANNGGGSGAGFSLFSADLMNNMGLTGSSSGSGNSSGLLMNPRTGVYDQNMLSGMGKQQQQQQLPQPIGTKPPNKEVEMFSDFLEFMKLKESGILDMLKSSGQSSDQGNHVMSGGGLSGSMSLGNTSMGSTGGAGSSYNPLAGMGMGISNMGVYGQQSGPGGGGPGGFMDLPSMAQASQMRKRKYTPF